MTEIFEIPELFRKKGIFNDQTMAEKVYAISYSEASSIIVNITERHKDDPNFPDSIRDLSTWITSEISSETLNDGVLSRRLEDRSSGTLENQSSGTLDHQFQRSSGTLDKQTSSGTLDKQVSNVVITPINEKTIQTSTNSSQCQINQTKSHHTDSQNKIQEIKIEAVLIKYHSPYPEVRSVTDSTDDVDIPAETIRMYLLGCIWVALGTFINQLFTTRQPSIFVSAPLLQLLVYPCGVLLQKIVPDRSVFGIKLNPGPWTSKEQMLVTIMFNIALGLPYANSQIFVQRLPLFYNNTWASSYGYQFLLLLSTQLMGFGIAGLAKDILVTPAQCIWPGSLPCLALNRALLRPKKDITKHRFSRYQFFMMMCSVSFFYFWLPDFLFEGLSNFSWLSWMKPTSHKLAMVTDMYGLGINPLPSLDWNILNSNDCLVTPFFSYVNTMIGCSLAGMIIIPALYWSNYKDVGYLPINSNRLFTNTGKMFDVSRVLTDKKFNDAKYQKYSPPFYSAAALVVYGAFFAYYPATIVYACLYYGRTTLGHMKRIIDKYRKSGDTVNIVQDLDAHCEMMAKYPDSPAWWYMTILILALIFGVCCVSLYPTKTPIWTIFVALAFGIIFLIPIGLMQAITNTSIGINVFTELIAGYALPGNGTAMMIMKAFGYNTNAQALHFCADLKLGHYAKVPPRATFRAQVLATILCVTVTIMIANWQIDHYPDICAPNQPQKFSCPSETTYFSASVFWGVIGPRRIFGVKGLYPVLPYCFLLGVFIPLPFYMMKLWKPRSAIVRGAHPLLIISGMLTYAPYSMAFYTGGLWLSILSHKYIRKRFSQQWDRYNYVLACALDSGTAIAAIIIFFALQYRGVTLKWWGNGAFSNLLSQKPILDAPEDPEWYIGPRKGQYP